jgi:hypothetical protein
MKLTYRGNFYEVPAPSLMGEDSTDQPKIKLIYRGDTYNYTPLPIAVSEKMTIDQPTVTLIYRGTTYERKLQPAKPYQKSSAVNWRWNQA